MRDDVENERKKVKKVGLLQKLRDETFMFKNIEIEEENFVFNTNIAESLKSLVLSFKSCFCYVKKFWLFVKSYMSTATTNRQRDTSRDELIAPPV